MAKFPEDVLNRNFNYGHPWCRTVVDMHTCMAIAKFKEQPFCDAGGKYHKTSRMYAGLHYSYRPELILADKAYIQTNPPEKFPNVVVLPEAWSTTTKFPVNNLLSVDSIYYPGVYEAIHAQLTRNEDSIVYVVMNVYELELGVHNLYDGEGSYEVTKYYKPNMTNTHDFEYYLKMRPKENGTNYEHTMRFSTSVGFHTFSTSIGGAMSLTFECLSYHPIANKAGNGLYKVSLTPNWFPI